MSQKVSELVSPVYIPSVDTHTNKLGVVKADPNDEWLGRAAVGSGLYFKTEKDCKTFITKALKLAESIRKKKPARKKVKKK